MGHFSVPEIEYFYSVRGRTYRQGVSEDEEMGRLLSNGVWKKTKDWANLVQTSISGFTVLCKKAWQKSGWDNGRVAQIKPYTWARIFRPEDSTKGIYFTVGVDADRQSLLIKIHYQERARKQAKSLLTRVQREYCEKLIRQADGAFLYCKEIHLQEVDKYSLERLTAETIAFVKHYESTYDLIVKLVWPSSVSFIESESSGVAISFEPGSGPKNVRLIEDRYIKPERLIQPHLVHLQVSQALYAYLAKEHGAENVRREMPTSNNTIIDMVHKENTELIFYEIKAYPSIRACIREAVGQLLEYSYWANVRPAKKLIIVTPMPADTETQKYMNNLRQLLKLPIWYRQFDLSQNTLGDEI